MMLLADVCVAIGLILTVLALVLLRIDRKDRKRFQQNSHVKVLEPHYDWAKDEDLNGTS